jgi:caa(3)-type oxidase subunit IV
VHRSHLKKLRLFLTLTILLGAAFLGVKAWEYSVKFAHGHFPGTAIFWDCYFMLTGFHGLHVLGGVIANLWILQLTLARDFSERRGHLVEISGPLPHMTQPQQPSYLKYFAIWGWLVALLVAGTLSPLLPFSRWGVTLFILLIALVKAVLVSLFYMHLKFEKIVPLWVVAVFPFFLIMLAVLVLLLGNVFL